MSDDVIKNPERNKERTYTPYVPEHIRLGKTPIMKDFSSLDGEVLQEASPSPERKTYVPENQQKAPSAPGVGDFILMVFGNIVAKGSEEFVLEEATAVLYGEHPQFLNANVKQDDLIVLKRISVKVGVFFDV